MRFVIAFIGFVLFASSQVQGQITLNSTDFGDIGDEIVAYSDTAYLGSLSTGANGPAQNWVFNLFQDFPDTVRFVDPQSTPNGSSFPNSNLALEEGVSYTYLDKSTAGIYLLGFNLDLDTFFSDASINLTPPAPYLLFPANFGDTYSATSSGSITFPFQDTFSIAGIPTYIDSIRVQFNVNQADSINGYGILTIDSGSTSVLRVESWQNITFDLFARVELFAGVFIWVPLPIPISPDLDFRTVNYFGKGFDYPLLTFELDSAGDIIGNSFQPIPIVNSLSKLNGPSSFEALTYPNPSSTRINFKESEGIKPISILDQGGKLIMKLSPSEVRDGLDISEWSNGIYFLKVKSGDDHFFFERIIKN